MHFHNFRYGSSMWTRTKSNAHAGMSGQIPEVVWSNNSNALRDKQAMMMPLHEQHASGAPGSVRDWNGEPAIAATKRIFGRRKQNPSGTSARSAPVDRRPAFDAG